VLGCAVVFATNILGKNAHPNSIYSLLSQNGKVFFMFFIQNMLCSALVEMFLVHVPLLFDPSPDNNCISEVVDGVLRLSRANIVSNFSFTTLESRISCCELEEPADT
jgi:hypothetical protein